MKLNLLKTAKMLLTGGLLIFTLIMLGFYGVVGKYLDAVALVPFMLVFIDYIRIQRRKIPDKTWYQKEVK